MAPKIGPDAGDSDDLFQELCLKLLERFESLGRDDCPRGRLAETIVDRLLLNLFRDSRAQKRHPRRKCSLSIVVDLDDDGRPMDLAATISNREYEARTGQPHRSAQEEFELRHDFDEVMSILSVEDRDLYKRLKRDTLSQVARDLDVPVSTLRDRTKRSLKSHEDADLRDYL